VRLAMTAPGEAAMTMMNCIPMMITAAITTQGLLRRESYFMKEVISAARNDGDG